MVAGLTLGVILFLIFGGLFAGLIALIAIGLMFYNSRKGAIEMPTNPQKIINGMAKFTGGYVFLSKKDQFEGRPGMLHIIARPDDTESKGLFSKGIELKEIIAPEFRVKHLPKGTLSRRRDTIIIYPQSPEDLPDALKSSGFFTDFDKINMLESEKNSLKLAEGYAKSQLAEDMLMNKAKAITLENLKQLGRAVSETMPPRQDTKRY